MASECAPGRHCVYLTSMRTCSCKHGCKQRLSALLERICLKWKWESLKEVEAAWKYLVAWLLMIISIFFNEDRVQNICNMYNMPIIDSFV